MLKAPSWCPHAHPTVAGWSDPVTGEVLVSANHTKAQVVEWHAARAPQPATVQTLHEAPAVESAVEPELVSFHYDLEIGEEEH